MLEVVRRAGRGKTRQLCFCCERRQAERSHLYCIVEDQLAFVQWQHRNDRTKTERWSECAMEHLAHNPLQSCPICAHAQHYHKGEFNSSTASHAVTFSAH